MKKWILVVPLLIVITFIIFISGYRFSALSAAKSNAFLSEDAELMEQYNIGSSVIFLFNSDLDQVYQTVLSEKSGLFFRSSLSTYIPYSSDKIQTVGGISFTTDHNEGALLSVISFDEDVAYIEAGIEPNIERKEIKKGERISFLYSSSQPLYSLYPVALNKEGKILYYYGYPKDSNIISSEDLKWYRFDGQQS
nr:hypothetical protein [Lysinibacillus timonensis]